MKGQLALKRVLIANRGEIALRVVEAARKLGIESVAVYTNADARSLHVLQADRKVCIGPNAPSSSYLNQTAIVHVAQAEDCDAIHPGYGFLSENPEFAALCETEGIQFIGPSSDTIQRMGNKVQARSEAMQAGVDVVPGSSQSCSDIQEAKLEAARIGYPVLIKARGGGGGRGMRVVSDESVFTAEFKQASAEAESAFGDPTIYLERYLDKIRHIEVQILGDADGKVVVLGERDCTVQRRHQKLVEEAPCPAIDNDVRSRLHGCAVQLGESIGYRGAGTVEFVLTQDRQQFYFIEMNTRIQVEHPVTEQLFGIDLIEAQLRVACGESVDEIVKSPSSNGHAIEFRINAEHWQNRFMPSPGKIQGWNLPAGSGVRVDTHCYETFSISPYYDSMIAKLIVHGHDRDHALRRAGSAIKEFEITGIETTLGFHQQLLQNDSFRTGNIYTTWVEREFLNGEMT